MSARPGRISAIIDIDLPRGRGADTREMERYFRHVTAVREALRGEDGIDAGDAGPGDADAEAAEAAARRVAAEGLSG
jgi:hypothetical protein